MQEDSQRLRIVVADDNEDTADALTELLEAGGHLVVTAYDGEGALQSVLDFRPQVGILDIGMPKMNGYEVAQAVRQGCFGTLLIAVSGWGTPSDVQRAKESGFDEHFTKPAAFADIEAVISRVKAAGGH